MAYSSKKNNNAREAHAYVKVIERGIRGELHSLAILGQQLVIVGQQTGDIFQCDDRLLISYLKV